jgi:hypothetical protein
MNGKLSGASTPDAAPSADSAAEPAPVTAGSTPAPESGSDASPPAGEAPAAASPPGEPRGKRGSKRRAAVSAAGQATATALGGGGSVSEGGASAPGTQGESAVAVTASGEHAGEQANAHAGEHANGHKVKKGKRKLKGKLKIVHQVPGRIRMKIPSAKGNEEQLANYKEVLALLPGVEEIDVNPVTGSIILKYDPDLNHNLHTRIDTHLDGHSEQPVRRSKPPPNNEIDAVAQKIQQEAEYLAEHSQTARAFVDFCAKVDKEIKFASKNVIDLKMLLAVGVVGFTVLEVGAAAATPVWVTLTLFGLNHFIEMQSDDDEAEPSPAGASAPAIPQPATPLATPPATQQVAAPAKATT